MTTATRSWVTIKEAAEQAGVSESRVRTAYRAGRLSVIDDLVDGRVRKLVDLPEVLAWAGVAPKPVEDPSPVAVPVYATVTVHEERFEEMAERIKTAVTRATRAEDQLALVRNELAQLREVYLRVSESMARREQAEFEASMRTMCASPTRGRSRRTVFGLVRRRTGV